MIVKTGSKAPIKLADHLIQNI